MRQQKSDLAHWPLVSSIRGLDCSHTYEPVFPGVHINDPGKRPLGRQERVLLQDDNVSCSEVSRRETPFVEFVQC